MEKKGEVLSLKMQLQTKTTPQVNVKTFTWSILSKISKKNKWYKDFFVHIVWLYLSLPSRYTFLNMHRYGGKAESTYRSHFGKSHDMSLFNQHLIQHYLSDEIIWAFDPSYISKSGRCTNGVGYFWSGLAQKMKWGMEIAHLSAVDIANQTALHYKAQQSKPNLKGETQLEFYANCIVSEKQALQGISNVCVQDAFFSKKPFVEILTKEAFEVISRFRTDVYLRYFYCGPQKGSKGKNIGKGKGSGGGRPKIYDGKVDIMNLNPQYFTACYQDEDEIAYEAIVHSRALGRAVKVVVKHKLNEDGSIKKAFVYFSSNLNRMGMDIILYYHLRFQQEFLFRDAKQFIGLQQCQARSEKKLDFHFNMSLTTLNVAKVIHHIKEEKQNQPFSMADIKTQYVNELLLDEAFDIFIEVSGIDPKLIKNNPKVLKLYNKGKIAA